MALTVDTIRNLVSDLGTPPLLEDGSYQQIIDLGETNAYRAASVACNQLSALFASKADITAGPVKLALSQKAEAYLSLGSRYMALADEGYGDDPDSPVTPATTFLGAIVTGISLDEMVEADEDTDRPPPAFVKGLDNNPGSDSSEAIFPGEDY